jgi:hypothetical protein
VKELFWETPWLHGQKPKDIAPLIYAISTRKIWKVCQPMRANAWVGKVVLGESFSLRHLSELSFGLTFKMCNLIKTLKQEISWKLMANGQYLAKSAY